MGQLHTQRGFLIKRFTAGLNFMETQANIFKRNHILGESLD